MLSRLPRSFLQVHNIVHVFILVTLLMNKLQRDRALVQELALLHLLLL